MSTEETLQIESSSLEDTLNLGVKLGQNCQGGETFLLVSDLGGGKTSLTQGLGKGLGVTDKITSPTFTISRHYHGAKLGLVHFDFYRLDDAGLVAHELAEASIEDDVVTAVEWGDVVSEVLPQDFVTITLSRVKDDENKRQITLKIPKSREYLRQGL